MADIFSLDGKVAVVIGGGGIGKALALGLARQGAKAASLHPIGRLAKAEELIGACVFLASPASDYMTGQIIYADGGRSYIV
ncbi:MAG: hypothetical protein A2Y65_04830 [Deltaproteobacteria bacterium RBG_13_52_11]|nr:MAG: hypothetical protein A2Y65_04830 [Deltaproteobacteria bacterium RBG_13_52_11]